MKYCRYITGLLVLTMASMAGCATTLNVDVEQTFPEVVAEPRDLSATLVMDQEFRTYQAQPNAKTRIQIGQPQIQRVVRRGNGGILQGTGEARYGSRNHPVGAGSSAFHAVGVLSQRV
jgi:hypothetical protein